MSLETALADYHQFGSIFQCLTGHRVLIPFRCSAKSLASCQDCRDKRSKMIIARLLSRLDRSELLRDNISMWTLGTNITYTRVPIDDRHYRDNISEIIKPWQKLNTRLKVYTKRKKFRFTWRPLFYVVEAGDEGNKLHIHLLARGYIPHFIIRKEWEKIIQVKNPNVNFIQDLKKVGYIAKYTAKGALTYRFLGELYKLKDVPYEKKTGCRSCGEKLYYSGQGYAKDV